MDNPEIEDSDTSYFRIGAALDCLLTSPERWSTDFKVIDVAKPFGLMGKFIDNLPPKVSPESDIEVYQEAYDKSGYKMNIQKVISKLWENEEFVKYYTLTKDIDESVIVLTSDEYESVEKAKELIDVNPYLRKYFKVSDAEIERLHQVPIYFKYREEDCKALLDGIYIDHLDRAIQPFDLKTSRSVWNFAESFLQYGYYRQCAFYELALKSETSPIKKYLDEGYELLDFIFIVVENKKSSSHPAIIYRTTSKDRECGIEGGYIDQRYYKGINDLIREYKYHRETNDWNLPVQLIESNGEIILDVFNSKK